MLVRREMLAAGLGLSLAQLSPAFGQTTASAPQTGRKARTTRMFKSPDLYPNALAATPEGLWLGQQQERTGRKAGFAPQTGPENIWLQDWNGKLLKTLTHEPCNTSGMAVGGGNVYVCGNDGVHDGAYQIGMDNKLASHRPMPLGGGGCHGGQWHDGKLWLVVNRITAMVRVDPKTFQPEYAIPIYTGSADTMRWHDMTIDDHGAIWIITGNDSKGPDTGHAGLARYDMATGKLLELVSFESGACDPHGLGFHDGKLVSCDAGHHPGWADQASPDSGWVFGIDIV